MAMAMATVVKMSTARRTRLLSRRLSEGRRGVGERDREQPVQANGTGVGEGDRAPSKHDGGRTRGRKYMRCGYIITASYLMIPT